MTDIVIIGSGNVAEALAAAAARSEGLRLKQIVSRNAVRGEELARRGGCSWCGDASQAAEADIYIAAVSDAAITQVLERLRARDGAVVAHTSGAQPLKAIPQRFEHRAVIYPLQTFTAGRCTTFEGVPFFTEGSDGDTAARAAAFARALGGEVFESDSELRARVHAAAVFACNFTNAMYTAGSEVLRRAGVPFRVLVPLIKETADKAVASGDPARVQTGPAARHDAVTTERHRRVLAELFDGEELRQTERLYNETTDYIWKRTSKKN